MAWLHTWSGLLLGWLLFAIFLTGTVSYFRQEISLWMRPELPAAGTPHPAEAASLAVRHLEETAPRAATWLIDLPTDRDPVIHVFARRLAGGSPQFRSERLDPTHGVPVRERATLGADSIYFFHFDLLLPSTWGRLVVGGCAVAMLVVLVSGIVTHRRIFRDFFTFRPGRGQRSWLDAHNAAGVLALPYHLAITYTGLIPLMLVYMPWGLEAAFPDGFAAFRAEARIALPAPPAAGEAAPLAAIGPLVDAATRRWGGAPPGRIAVHHPGDANAMIDMTRADEAAISYRDDKLRFDGVSGVLIDDGVPGGAAQAYAVLYGLHLGRFAGPTLRWLLFLSGIAGTAAIATGLVLWTVKRRPAGATGGPSGHRLASSLTVAVVAGLPIALAALFWANRLLPLGIPGRASLEVACAGSALLAAGLHAAVRRPQRAWTEQLGAGATLFGTLPLVNAMTTDRHLAATLTQGDWARAGFDLAVLVTGLAMAWGAWTVARRARRSRGRRHRA